MKNKIIFCFCLALTAGCTESPPSASVNWKSASAPVITTSSSINSDINGIASNPVAISDSSGNITVVWEQYATESPSTDENLLCQRTDLLYQTYTNSSDKWSDVTTFQTGTLRSIATLDTKDGLWKRTNEGLETELVLRRGQDNRLFALWIQDSVSDCDVEADLVATVYYSQFSPSTNSWATPALMMDTPSETASQPALAVSSQDFAIAAWKVTMPIIETDNGIDFDTNRRVSVIYASHFDSVSTWGTPFIISDDNGATPVKYYESDTPRATINDNGYGSVVWRQLEEDGVFEAHATPYSADTGWGTSSSTINTSSDVVTNVQVAIDADNTSWVVWTGADSSGINSLYVNTMASDQTLGTEAALQGDLASTTDDESEQHVTAPDLAIDSSGEVTVAWLQPQPYDAMDNKWNNTTANSLWVNRFIITSTSSSWSGATVLVNDQRVSVKKAAASAVGSSVILTWLQDNDSRDEHPQSVFSARFNAQWSTPALAKQLDSNAESFTVTGNTDHIVATWSTVDKELSGSTYTSSSQIHMARTE